MPSRKCPNCLHPLTRDEYSGVVYYVCEYCDTDYVLQQDNLQLYAGNAWYQPERTILCGYNRLVYG